MRDQENNQRDQGSQDNVQSFSRPFEYGIERKKPGEHGDERFVVGEIDAKGKAGPVFAEGELL